MQLLRPSLAANEPGGHSSGARDCSRQYEPTVHDAHALAPLADWNVPSAQPVHRLAFPVEKLPAALSQSSFELISLQTPVHQCGARGGGAGGGGDGDQHVCFSSHVSGVGGGHSFSVIGA